MLFIVHECHFYIYIQFINTVPNIFDTNYIVYKFVVIL
jgi:hypothetical protein